MLGKPQLRGLDCFYCVLQRLTPPTHARPYSHSLLLSTPLHYSTHSRAHCHSPHSLARLHMKPRQTIGRSPPGRSGHCRRGGSGPLAPAGALRDCVEPSEVLAGEPYHRQGFLLPHVCTRGCALKRWVLPCLWTGYVQKPHTGLASVIAELKSSPQTRYLILTRDVLLASGECPTTQIRRDDVDVHLMPRTRQEIIELLRARKRMQKPLMVVCRLSSSLSKGADVQCTSRAVHQLRRLADEHDVHRLLVTLLLPPKTLHESRCYEAAFLGSWQIFHLDCLDDAESPALVASILSPSAPDTEDHVVSEDELQKDLWASVARLSASEGMRKSAEAWMHEAKGFYSGAALQTRVDLLWQLLSVAWQRHAPTDAHMPPHCLLRPCEHSLTQGAKRRLPAGGVAEDPFRGPEGRVASPGVALGKLSTRAICSDRTAGSSFFSFRVLTCLFILKEAIAAAMEIMEMDVRQRSGLPFL